MGTNTPTQPQFVVGERWSYDTRPHEESSTFVVGLVEESDTGRVIHIRVDHVTIDGARPQTYLTHVPMEENALSRSRRVRLATTSFLEGILKTEFELGVRTFKSDAEARPCDDQLGDVIQFVEDIVTGRAKDLVEWPVPPSLD